MNRSVVYFVLHERHPEIRVGFTKLDSQQSRLKAHSAYGFKGMTAIVPGTFEDEQATHRLLDKFRVEESIYRAEEPIVEYVEQLLDHGRAAPTMDDALTWPALAFPLWCFGSQALQHVDQNGQPTLWHKAPVRERLEYAHKHAILQSRGDEWYTPPDLIKRAHHVMGRVDLDPASCPIANRTVKARMFYTKAMNGLNLALPWAGRVWLNPPYGRGPQSAGAFIERLVSEWQSRRVTEAIVCLNLNSMSSEWFRPLHDVASAHGIAYGRPSYIAPDDQEDSSPTKGTVLVYLGASPEKFAAAYGDICAIYSRYIVPLEQTA